jgi:hypothetical protein
MYNANHDYSTELRELNRNLRNINTNISSLTHLIAQALYGYRGDDDDGKKPKKDNNKRVGVSFEEQHYFTKEEMQKMHPVTT